MPLRSFMQYLKIKQNQLSLILKIDSSKFQQKISFFMIWELLRPISTIFTMLCQQEQQVAIKGWSKQANWQENSPGYTHWHPRGYRTYFLAPNDYTWRLNVQKNRTTSRACIIPLHKCTNFLKKSEKGSAVRK